MNKKAIIIPFLLIFIMFCLWIFCEYLKINKLKRNISDATKIILSSELACARNIHRGEQESTILKYRNYFTIKYLLKELADPKIKDKNKNLCALLIMLSTPDMYEKYKKDIDNLFSDACKYDDPVTLDLFTNYFSNIANKQVLDKLIKLSKKKSAAFRAILTLAITMRYNIETVIELSKNLDSGNIIILLSGSYKKLSQRQFSQQAVSYYKQLAEQYNTLIFQRIQNNPSFFESVSFLPKLLLADIWITNELHLDICGIALNSITEERLEAEDKVYYFVLRARLAEKLKDYEQATKYIDKALEIYPANQEIYARQITLFEERKDWGIGCKFMKKYLYKIYGKDWFSAIISNNDEANALKIVNFWYNANSSLELMETLLKYFAYSVKSNNAKNILAYFWAEHNKNLPEALKICEEIIRNESNNVAFIYTHGYVLLKNKLYKKSLSQLLIADKLYPNCPQINVHLGDVYFALNEKHEAKQAWEKALNFVIFDKQFENEIVEKLKMLQ